MISPRSLLLATCLLASAGNAAAGYMPPESRHESATNYTHTPDGVGLLIAENKNGTTRHIYADAQGSARLVTDAQGNTLETLDFDAFGNETATNTKETRHRYTGESFDSATGLYHLRARDYDPNTGRFISMDEHPGSQRIPLSLNKYLYGNADPVNTIDPSGNMGLAGVGVSLSLSSNLHVARISSGMRTAWAIYEKLDNALLMRDVISAVWNAWGMLYEHDWEKHVKGAQKDSGFINAIANFDYAIVDFAANAWRIFNGIATSKSGISRSYISNFLAGKNKKHSLVIYGPTPDTKTFWLNAEGKGSRHKIGSISLTRGKAREVWLEMGARKNQGGRMFGVGHTTKTSDFNAYKQWFRQDWHPAHGNENLVSAPYHYHWDVK